MLEQFLISHLILTSPASLIHANHLKFIKDTSCPSLKWLWLTSFIATGAVITGLFPFFNTYFAELCVFTLIAYHRLKKKMGANLTLIILWSIKSNVYSDVDTFFLKFALFIECVMDHLIIFFFMLFHDLLIILSSCRLAFHI